MKTPEKNPEEGNDSPQFSFFISKTNSYSYSKKDAVEYP
jgi:hypothetical protein